MKRVIGAAAAAWGIAGVLFIIGRAVARLASTALEGLAAPGLTAWHWIGLAGWLLFMGYYEGYKGFQRAFSPRVVLRALHLAKNPRPLHVALAPMYVMGLIHASRRRLIVSWMLVAVMVGLVLGVRHVAQPWRGLIDAGVVVGLVWGMAAMVLLGVRALLGRPPGGGLDLPGEDSPAPEQTPSAGISRVGLCASGG